MQQAMHSERGIQREIDRERDSDGDQGMHAQKETRNAEDRTERDKECREDDGEQKKKRCPRVRSDEGWAPRGQRETRRTER